MRGAVSAVGGVLTDLFFPPRCAGCGALLPPFRRLHGGVVPALCADCLPQWEKARAQVPDGGRGRSGLSRTARRSRNVFRSK